MASQGMIYLPLPLWSGLPLFPSLTLFQPHQPTGCFSKNTSILWPQSLCSCPALCPELCSPRELHGSIHQVLLSLFKWLLNREHFLDLHVTLFFPHLVLSFVVSHHQTCSTSLLTYSLSVPHHIEWTLWGLQYHCELCLNPSRHWMDNVKWKTRDLGYGFPEAPGNPRTQKPPIVGKWPSFTTPGMLILNSLTLHPRNLQTIKQNADGIDLLTPQNAPRAGQGYQCKARRQGFPFLVSITLLYFSSQHLPLFEMDLKPHLVTWLFLYFISLLSETFPFFWFSFEDTTFPHSGSIWLDWRNCRPSSWNRHVNQTYTCQSASSRWPQWLLWTWPHSDKRKLGPIQVNGTVKEREHPLPCGF